MASLPLRETPAERRFAMSGKTKILVVDDELIQREALIGWLRKSGREVDGSDSGAGALSLLGGKDYDLVFLDLAMPGMNGIEVLERIREEYPRTVVVMITAFGSVETAVEAMKRGARDYLVKPIEPETLAARVDALLNTRRSGEEESDPGERRIPHDACSGLMGTSPCMRWLHEVIEQVAEVDSPVLLRGETGTGKELVARAIHAMSDRRFSPFIPINCGAFAESLLESELFGHEKGAFTGARGARKGRIEMARGGTLFLDEVGEIPLKMQVDLLRVLEEKCVQRVGGDREIPVDFRLVSATHRDLEREIERGSIRRDFYYRLNVIEVEIPPLRARSEDIPALALHFLERFRRDTNKPVEGVDREGLEFLRSYPWPGNVRELENAVERAVVLARGRHLGKNDFLFLVRPSERNTPKSLTECEKRHIGHTLDQCGWNITRAAVVLEVSRITLRTKIRKYGLHPASA